MEMEVDEENTVENEIDGSIISIHVRNFFCHDNLEVNFNRNVNFIVGRNGSGKSAILTALVVGLGGRASATNRGNNLHSFIKKGANSASVEIKIKNDSPVAYKPNVYGNSITIIRNITGSGGSSYRIKSATGETISTRFEDVHSIILAHDIQVDNPISVLNQDDARSFHASDSKKKYALFRKATNLDQTEMNYAKALENCKKAEIIMNRKKEACVEQEKEYKKLRNTYEQLQSRDDIEAKRKAVQNEYYWSEIVDLEKDYANVQAQFDKQNVRIYKLLEKLSQMEQNYSSNTDLIDTLKAQLEEKSVEKSSLEHELVELEGKMRELNSGLRLAQNAASKQRDVLKREKRKVNDLEREIQSIDSGSAASRRAALEAEVAATAAAAEAARARSSTAQHDAAQARAAAERAQQAADTAARRARAQADDVKKLKQLLRELQSRGDDSLAVYGGNAAELNKRVQAAYKKGLFSEMPRGPIGAYLKLKEKRWGGALEHILGGSIQAYCVNTPEDSRKLFEIMEQVYGNSAKPSVTCSRFLPAHGVRRAVRARGHGPALAALVAADPVVHNYLLDVHALETVLLVPDHEEAIGLTSQEENVPAHCGRVVTLDCTEYHPAPNYRSYGGQPRAVRYLALSTAERQRQLQAELTEAEEKLASLEATSQEEAAQLRAAQEVARGAGAAAEAMLAERAAREQAARAAALQHAALHAPHHAVLAEELNITKEKTSTLGQQLETLEMQERQIRSEVDALDDQARKVKNRLGKITAACRNLSEEVDQERMKLDQGSTERATYERRLREDRGKLDQVQHIIDEKKAVIDTKIADASKLCPRIERPRDKAIVQDEYRKLELKLNSLCGEARGKAQVGELLLAAERRYLHTRGHLQRLAALIHEVQGTAARHLQQCQRVQSCVARNVQHAFQALLTVRGYSGQMEIDAARGVLEVRVSGREAARRAGSTASLSGGERSYSTVAFILALWDCVELPFYFMDEFDVFMDSVNRKMVMELLVDYARRNRNRQFVFLTPQDASAIVADQYTKIHRMADPRP